MDPTGFPALTSCPTCLSAPGAISDRPEAEIDRPGVVLPPGPTGMVLCSQSRAGRSEVVVRADIHSERSGIVPRPEPEIARPETEFAPVAGSSSDPTAVGTSLPSPPTRCGTETVAETMSGYPFPARQELEITPIRFYPFHHTEQPRSFTHKAVVTTAILLRFDCTTTIRRLYVTTGLLSWRKVHCGLNKQIGQRDCS